MRTTAPGRPRIAHRAVLAALFVFAATAAAAQSRGHLVIIGGGLDPGNAAIYNRILERAPEGATVGVLPTASGVPERSGKAYVEDFERYGGPGRAEMIFITTSTAQRANDPEWVARIARHKILFFTGGDQSRITRVFRPEGGTTLAHKEMQRILAEGGVIAGSSAGAAMMSDPMIRGGSSPRALRHGVALGDDDPGVGVGVGMGFFPYGITGQHFLRRGRMGRMVVALEHTGHARGFGVDNNSAMSVDLATGRIETLGDRGLLVVDLAGAEKLGLRRENLRLSLLNDRDVVDGETGAVVPAEGRRAIWPDDAAPDEGPATLLDPWGRDVIARGIEQLARRRAVMLEGDDFMLTLSRDAQTRLWTPDGATAPVTAAQVRCDIEPRAEDR